jgi:cell division protein ZapA
MAQVSITVNGRRYDIGCDDGQEPHVFRLAEGIDRRIATLVEKLGQVGEARLLLLASLLLADELADLRAERAAINTGEAGGAGATDQPNGNVDNRLGDELRSLAERIEAVANSLRGTQTIAEPSNCS